MIYSYRRKRFNLNLDTNENAYPPPPGLITEFRKNTLADLNMYPERQSRVLREKIAKPLRVNPANILLGNGSDEIIELLIAHAKKRGGRMFSLWPSFEMFRVLADKYRVPFVPVPSLTRDPAEDLAKTLRKKKPRGSDLIIIANPNNPTGRFIEPRTLGKILASKKGVRVIDEAYVDFSGETMLGRLGRGVDGVLRTMSKGWSLAGIRLGYGIFTPGLFREIEPLVLPYNVNSLSLRMGILATRYRGAFAGPNEEIRRNREILGNRLRERGLLVWPSKANFLFFTGPRLGPLFTHLARKGLLVRRFRYSKKVYLRMAVPKTRDMRAVEKALDSFYRK